MKIVNEKLQWNTRARIDAKHDAYTPRGGDVTIVNNNKNWKSVAMPRIDARNAAYKPGGGDKKIVDDVRRWNVTSRVNATNANYKPAGGDKLVFK